MLRKHRYSGKKYGGYLIVKWHMVMEEDVDHTKNVLREKKGPLPNFTTQR